MTLYNIVDFFVCFCLFYSLVNVNTLVGIGCLCVVESRVTVYIMVDYFFSLCSVELGNCLLCGRYFVCVFV
jgi:hypothetical protein